MANSTEIAIFASGCFWGTEHIFVKHFPPAKGILATRVGYTGGSADSVNPDYKRCAAARRSMQRRGKLIVDRVPQCDLHNDPEQADTAKRVTEEVQAKHFTPNDTKIVTTMTVPGRGGSRGLPPVVPAQQPRRIPLPDP
ncbi:peptide methionine sulfoxide reductase [Mycena leptocephala]|nr:peptide methionine sulfoxide reductase [Mycena leptocephala]